jgi:hypothetical protein
METGPPYFTVIKTDQFIPGRCSPAVHDCASSARNTTINQSINRQSSTQSPTITVNGDPVAISSSGEFREVVRDRASRGGSWSGVVLALSLTTGWNY